MPRVNVQKSTLSHKILWASTGIFAISGVLPWLVLKFPIGNLKISIIDLILYFIDNQGIKIDIYSTVIYEILLAGWIFTLALLIVSATLKKTKLVLLSVFFTIIPSLIWMFVVPHLRVQMIFLSLSNQPLNSNQTMGSGEIAALVAGVIAVYSYIRLKV